MSVKGAQRAADRGLSIIEEIIAASRHTPIAENTRIPRGLRQRLVEQATQEAQQASQPMIDQLRAQLPALRRAMHSEVRSIEGANEMAAEAVSDVSTKGLHGLAKKQLAEELASREADILASTPLLASEARQTFQTEKAEVAQSVAEAQAQQTQSVAKAVAAALSSARSQIHTRADQAGDAALSQLETNTETRGDSSVDQHKQFNLALAEAKRLLEQYPADVPENEAEWRAFARVIADAEGITNLEAARAAMERVRKLLRQSESPFAQSVNAEGPAAQALATITGEDTGIIDRFG